jgi:hypothetical protein
MDKRLKPLRAHSTRRLMKRSTRGVADFMKRRFSRESIAQFRSELGSIIYSIDGVELRNRNEIDRIDCKFARELLSELPLVPK